MYLTFPCEDGTLVRTGGPGVAGNCTTCAGVADDCVAYCCTTGV